MASISRSDFARLVLRVGVGGVMAAHGTQKLFGWFGGGGLAGTAGHLESAGFRPGRMNAIVAGVTETAGGVLLAAGLATPSTGAAVASTMAVAAATHAPQGFFAMKGGYEYPAVLGLASGTLALAGAGRLSLDELLHQRLGGDAWPCSRRSSQRGRQRWCSAAGSRRSPSRTWLRHRRPAPMPSPQGR